MPPFPGYPPMWGFEFHSRPCERFRQPSVIRHPGAQCHNALATPNPAQTGARSRFKGDAFISVVWSANVFKVPGQARARVQRPGREHG